MTVKNFLGDIEDGNFSHAWKRLQDLFATLPPGVQSFIKKAGTQEYTILKGLTAIALKDIITGGFSTASFVLAGKDVLEQLIAQNITIFTMQDVMADLNMSASLIAPASVVLPTADDLTTSAK